MDITYFGHSSFRIRGKSATVICDPYDSEKIGLKFPKHSEADIITVSHEHPDHNAVRQVEGTPFVVRGPGEYEIKGVGIVGFPVFHDNEKGAKRGANTMYRIEVDGVSIVHLGDLGHALSADEVDELDGVDVLLVPVGGFYTIDAAQAVSMINEIEPHIVIPMHFGRRDLSPTINANLSPLPVFLKEIGKEAVAPVPKLTVSKDKLPGELQVVVLE